jgi:hypothetical protein
MEERLLLDQARGRPARKRKWNGESRRDEGVCCLTSPRVIESGEFPPSNLFEQLAGLDHLSHELALGIVRHAGPTVIVVMACAYRDSVPLAHVRST